MSIPGRDAAKRLAEVIDFLKNEVGGSRKGSIRLVVTISYGHVL
jgi:hypothetical protein